MPAESDQSTYSENIRPVVALGSSGNGGMWAFGALLLLGGVWIFSMMSANRADVKVPITSIEGRQPGGRITSPPALAFPQSLIQAPEAEAPPVRLRALPPAIPRPNVRPVTPVRAVPVATPPSVVKPPPKRPAVVFDEQFQSRFEARPDLAATKNRVNADRLMKPSQTITQGTVIPAVLETALDSTRPGAARALVQLDIYSFDGTRILIPRGSRLYGEYESGLTAGQNRALIQWTRLIRPDAVTIALDSPSSDPLGRAGVKGKVDSKFFERFGGAILQSALDLGVGVLTQKASSSDNLVLALPGSTQNLQIQDNNRAQRTLKIRHGTSVSVFVARDLDFSNVDH